MINLNRNDGFKLTGEIIRDFLKGELIYNERTKEIGKVVGFYVTSEENTSIKNARYFRVEKVDGKETNWFLDLKDGDNEKLHLLPKSGLENLL